MRRRAAIVSLLFAWLCATGALLNVAQVLVWGKMFAGYRTILSVAAAFEATLDPAKACALCGGIAQARDLAEKNLPPDSGHDAKKIVLVVETPLPVIVSRVRSDWPGVRTVTLPDCTKPVPFLPPRV